jgi:predicted nucleotidyltransferase
VETVPISTRNFREGDFIQTHDSLIFDVKGLVHPPDRVIAFLRYYPSETGDRTRDGLKYGKVYPLNDRFSFLKKRCPSYIYFDKVFDSIMQGVPKKDVARFYEPAKKLTELATNPEGLDDLEKDSIEFCRILSSSAEIPLNRLGLTGSILVGLHTTESDIDLIVYGYDNCIAVYEALGSLHSDPHSLVKPYGGKELRKLFKFRSSDTSTEWESFLLTEKRRRLQGLFKNHDYFIRFIKDWHESHETYGDVTYKSLGEVVIKATVADDSEALFTPCTYKIRDTQLVREHKAGEVMIREVASFRGRFCEIARNGERITARGKLELVSDRTGNSYHRVLVGGDKGDFFTLA